MRRSLPPDVEPSGYTYKGDSSRLTRNQSALAGFVRIARWFITVRCFSVAADDPYAEAGEEGEDDEEQDWGHWLRDYM